MASTYFEFVVPGPPLSVNTKKSQPEKHRKWQTTIAHAASQQWQTEQRDTTLLPTKGPVEMVITTFFTALPLDVDNVIKPILDSLKGTLYIDDKQVYKLTSERIDLNKFDQTTLSKSISDTLVTFTELLHVALIWDEKET